MRTCRCSGSTGVGGSGDEAECGRSRHCIDLGGDGCKAECVDISGVDPSNERADEPFEYLVTQAAAHETADGLVAGSRGRPGVDQVGSESSEPLRREHLGEIGGVEIGGDAQQVPCGKGNESAIHEHSGDAGCGRDEPIAEPDSGGKFSRPRNPCEERVGSLVDWSAGEDRGAQFSTELCGFEHHHRCP